MSPKWTPSSSIIISRQWQVPALEGDGGVEQGRAGENKDKLARDVSGEIWGEGIGVVSKESKD
jgi:hypothetical protein